MIGMLALVPVIAEQEPGFCVEVVVLSPYSRQVPLCRSCKLRPSGIPQDCSKLALDVGLIWLMWVGSLIFMCRPDVCVVAGKYPRQWMGNPSFLAERKVAMDTAIIDLIVLYCQVVVMSFVRQRELRYTQQSASTGDTGTIDVHPRERADGNLSETKRATEVEEVVGSHRLRMCRK